MVTTIKKWGNSLAIRIPNTFVKETSLENGDIINIAIKNYEIVLSKPKATLNYLLSKINSDNLHKEIQIHGPIGKEIW
jgi:antitoxin MazE